MRRTIYTLTVAAVAALTIAQGASALAPVGPEVVGLWQGEGSASDPFNGHDGTLLGVVFAPAASGRAFSFTGEQQAVDIPDSPALYPTTSFTVAGWIASSISSGFQTLMGHYECGLACPTGLANSVFLVGLEEGRAWATIRDTDKGGPIGEGEGQVLAGTRQLADGRAHHIAFERDSAAGELRLYVDGVLEASGPLNEGSIGPLENLDGEADDLYLGSYRRCSGGGGGCDGTLVSQLTGTIDDAIYWSRAVTGPELAAIVAAGPNGLTTDSTAPASAASAPATAKPGTIHVSFTAGDPQGPGAHVHDPSGLARVDLYAKSPGQAQLAKVAELAPAASGTFEYKAPATGTYEFATAAVDLAGNAEALPASADAKTVVTTPAPTPTIPTRISQVVAGLPSTRQCVSKRAFTIHIVVPKGVKIISAQVFVNGRSVAVRKGRKLAAPVDLRGLPKARYSVKVTVRFAGGKVLSETRRYRTCVKKRRH